MSQQQKSKLGIGTIIVACLVAAAGLAVLRGVNQPRTIPKVNTQDELVTFVVTFGAGEVMIEGKDARPFGPFYESKTPWVREELVPPGTEVWVKVYRSTEGSMSCRIRKGLKVVAPHKEASGPGDLRCAGVT